MLVYWRIDNLEIMGYTDQILVGALMIGKQLLNTFYDGWKCDILEE